MLQPLPCAVTVDIEGGFSPDPDEVGALGATLRDLGAVGVNVEDGAEDGSLHDPQHQAAVLRAIRSAAPELFVNARIDTYWLATAGNDLRDATLQRAWTYLEAGADGIFVPGVARDDDVAHLVQHIAAPLNVLFLPVHHTVADLAAHGVARISTGSLLFRHALHATVAAAIAIRDGTPLIAGVPSYADVQDLGRAACPPER